MRNKAMERKLSGGEAIDVSECKRTPKGEYILDEFESDVDYCDAVEEAWIWSIGRDLKTGQVLASQSSKFYQNPDYECLWLR